VLEVPDDELEAVRRLVCAEMENAYSLDAALKVDVKMGRNWMEME
jgi:DNA polymerase I-like protein with 3'-5' exonuclease and polymerase domains